MHLGKTFKALSDGTRREILRILQGGDLTAGEIADHFALSKPSISHHLNVLKQANLVQDVRKGQHIYYSLNTTVFQDLLSWLLDVLQLQDDGSLGKVKDADDVAASTGHSKEWKGSVGDE